MCVCVPSVALDNDSSVFLHYKLEIIAILS